MLFFQRFQINDPALSNGSRPFAKADLGHEYSLSQSKGRNHCWHKCEGH